MVIVKTAMQQLSALRASSLPPAELNAILGDYLALDRARIYRRLFIVRFGLLAAAATIVGVVVPTLPSFARWCPPAVCFAPPIAAWIRERRLARRLARRLQKVPGGTPDVVISPRA
jgi:hypothetical protein